MKTDKKLGVCFICSLFFVLGFIFSVIKDYVTYHNTLNSAPFYIDIMINVVCFLLPALIFAFVGWIRMRKY